jgi:hypothetical protein
LKVFVFAKNMESILTRLCEKSDVSHGLPIEFAERFDALRRYGRLPRGREKHGQLLTNGEVAAAILGPSGLDQSRRSILEESVRDRPTESIKTPAHENPAGVSSIELFFDLVFVFGITQGEIWRKVEDRPRIWS